VLKVNAVNESRQTNGFETMGKMTGLIVGCGYLGLRIAKLWLAAGVEAHALTRSPARAEWLFQQGIRPWVVDWYQSTAWPAGLPTYQRVAICVSHAPVVGLPPERTHVQGLENLLSNVAPAAGRWLYLSTTGVYAPCDDGRWLDEQALVNPGRGGALAALAAERWLEEQLPADGLVILRAAGIYGPERVPRLAALRAGEPLEADPSSYLNLIHVEDLARLAQRMIEPTCRAGVYNVSDGNPVRRREYYQFLSRLLNAPPPVFFDTEKNRHPLPVGFGRSRGEGSKRVSIEKLRKELDYPFLFPDYQAGLRPLLEGS
jgi:nucleoside-diphosphate-sugar epimerase